MTDDIRRYLKIIQEGIYDEEMGGDDEAFGSQGWWVYPDGTVEEMAEMGSHGVTAHGWLKGSVPDYSNDDFDEAIDHLQQMGGIRVATFHGDTEMNIDFQPQHVTVAARRALLKLIKDTRSEFTGYWVDQGDGHPRTLKYRQALAYVSGKG